MELAFMALASRTSTGRPDRRDRTARARTCLRGLLGGLVLVTVACGERTVRLPILDLAASFPEAEVHRPVAEIDLGTFEAAPHLGHGWSANERAEDGTTFVWATGPRSELELFLPRRQALDLRLRVRPFVTAQAPVQKVTLNLNGRDIGTFRAREAALHTYRMRVPSGYLTVGMNRLTFLYKHSTVPAETGAGSDERELSLAWDRLRIGNLPTIGGDGPAADGNRLRIPIGTEVVYTLPMPDDLALAFTAAEVIGDGQLAVLVDSDHVGPMAESRIVGSAKPRTVSLGESVSGLPVRVTLRAETRSRPAPGEGWHGVVLENPKLVGRLPAASPPPTNPQGAPKLPRGGRTLRPGPPDIVVYVVGSLRVDRLGCYGYGGGFTKAIDELAADGIVFLRSRAGTSSTKASMTSLLTGVSPLDHRVFEADDALPRTLATLAERLTSAGWTTGAFLDSPELTAAAGFDRGFQRFDRRPSDAVSTVERALEWLDGAGEDPVFTLIYVGDARMPYQPPAEEAARFAAGVADPAIGGDETLGRLMRGERAVDDATRADLDALYSAEVAFSDRALGRYVEGLRARNRYRDTAIVVAADHGTAFFEHGRLGDGDDLFGEQLRVPLVVKLRGEAGAGARSQLIAEHTDLVPTLLAMAELPSDPALPGWNLLPTIGQPVPARASIAYHEQGGRDGIAIFDGRWTLIVPLSASFASAPALYDLDDPLETTNRIFNWPVRAALLGGMARHAVRHRGPTPPRISADNELRDQLHELGLRARSPDP